jgi:hypothetical protein
MGVESMVKSFRAGVRDTGDWQACENGRLTITSSAATGTEVHLSIPGELAFQRSPADHVQLA